jgi:GNAT superfamily N-acetyltransferase
MMARAMLADLALCRRLERAEARANARFVEARARIEPSLGAAWIEVAGAWCMFDGPDSPVTQAFGLGLFAEPTDAELDHIERFFFDRGAPCHLEISPLAGLDLTRRLVQRAYLPEEQSNVLYQPLPPESGFDIPVQLRVRVVGPTDIPVWSEISRQGWSDFPEVADYVLNIGPVIAAREDGVSFLAELEGRPVAAGALCVAEGVAVFAGACTIPDARRHGAQRALLGARLEYAVEHGCDLAAVVNQPGSAAQRNSERNGFRVAYTRTKWFRTPPGTV